MAQPTVAWRLEGGPSHGRVVRRRTSDDDVDGIIHAEWLRRPDCFEEHIYQYTGTAGVLEWTAVIGHPYERAGDVRWIPPTLAELEEARLPARDHTVESIASLFGVPAGVLAADTTADLPNFCREGCYWPCDHRFREPPSSRDTYPIHAGR